MNRNKCSITGFGKWFNKTDWPIEWLKCESNVDILGICYCETADKTLAENWGKVIQKLERKINMLSNRCLTLFQKAIIVNTLLLSKVWYIAHTLPLKKVYSQKINCLIFRYLWRGNYHPIKRSTLLLPKNEGGLGIIDVFHKAASILSATSLKESLKGRELNIYNCGIRLSHLVEVDTYKELSYITSPFYSGVIENIRVVSKHKNFPNLKSKDMYGIIFPKSQPSVEDNYPLYMWKSVWENLNNPVIGIKERDFLFRHLHERLATNTRLKLLGIRSDGSCDFCGEPEYAMHIFYFCKKVNRVFHWFKCKFRLMCTVKQNEWLRLLMLDIKGKSKVDQNTVVILISTYLYCIWIIRLQKIDEKDVICFVKGKLNHVRWSLNTIYGENLGKFVTQQFISANL